MKKPAKVSFLAISIFMLSFSSHAQKPAGEPWPAPASAISMKNPVKADANSLSVGKDLYIKNCKSCHGTSGKGDGTKASGLDISCGDFSLPAFKKISDGELYWKITEGRKPMPTYAKKLTDQERWAVVNYIRTFVK